MNKTILITGSTDGIGKLAAIKLAQAGHNIYIHGRKSEKLTAVIAEVKAISGNQNIKGFIADFSDLKAVRNMAAEVKNEISSLDILINNAGVFNSPIAQTKDGFDIRFAVNYFAPVVLTNALLPIIETSPDPRIINLSSAAQDTVNYDLFAGNIQASERAAYGQSKLALTMWSFHLAQKHPNITITPVNPGSLLNTNMVKEAFGTFWSSAEKGADILYDLAELPEYKGVTGQYFDNDKGGFGKAHMDAYDEQAIDWLIQETKRVLQD